MHNNMVLSEIQSLIVTNHNGIKLVGTKKPPAKPAMALRMGAMR